MAERLQFHHNGAKIKIYTKSFSIDGRIVYIGSPGDAKKLGEALEVYAERIRKQTRREIREALGIKLKFNLED